MEQVSCSEKSSKFNMYEGFKVRKYNIKTTNVPRYNYLDPECSKLISEQKPVIITDSNLVEPALKWDLDYLKKNLGDASNSVYVSDNDTFLHFDEQKCCNEYSEFKSQNEKMDMPFSDIYNWIHSWKPGKKRIYMQQMLRDCVSERMISDFLKFNWKWSTYHQIANGWGDLTSNVLLIGLAGNITPLHFDEQENFFAQTKGVKRCILYPPEQFKCLYPFPYHHPCDRQSQIDLEKPDHNKFPLFDKAIGLETIIKPGEVLYIPLYWWHYFESVQNGGVTISINFWYKQRESITHDDMSFPLKIPQKIALMRNIERLLGLGLGRSDEIGCLLNTIVNGRYQQDESYLNVANLHI